MTALAQRDPQAAPGVGGSRQRVGRLLRTEGLLAWRLGVIVATVVVTGLWITVLRIVAPAARDVLTPVVLLTDVTALGFLFVPALLMLERVEGVEAAMRTTPVRTAERIAARLGVMTGLSVAAAAAICVAADAAHVGPRLLGVVLLSVLFGLVAFALTGSATTLTTFLLRAPLVAAPLMAPAIAHLLGATTAAAVYLSPVTSAVDLLRGELHGPGLAWQLLCIAAVASFTARSDRRRVRAPTGTAVGLSRRRQAHRAGAWPAHPGSWASATAVRSFARADRRTLLRDGLLLLLVASVPLLALVLRFIATAGVAWARQRHGIALAPHLPAIQVLLLVIHTPMVFGALTGLLLLEDRDAGLFGPLSVTRAGLSTLIVYRLAATAAITTGALVLSLPFTDVPHPAGIVGVLATAAAAGTASTVPALVMAAVASNRVQGIAAMKMLGLPLYLPLATWAMTGPVRWLFAPLPTAWPTWAAWASTPDDAVAAAAGGIAVTAAYAVPLARRILLRPLAS